MKIAIHHRQGSFSDRWIIYCEQNDLDYKVVNAFDSDIVQQLKGCDTFIWHHHHGHLKDVIAAKKILFALEHAGVKVFPDFKTGWHFDDKVAQKYLLEAIDAPTVPSYAFYDKKEALSWAKKTMYPKVFKLKGGAGATNVKLVKSQKEALNLINKAFNKGFPQFDRIDNLKDKVRSFYNGQEKLLGVSKGIVQLLITTEFSKKHPHEKGYIYFQDFIPNNTFDIRVVVIGKKIAAAERRMVRKNDFRASGSGFFDYDGIDSSIIEISFEVAERLNLQSVAFDFILDENKKPLIVEMSYGFGTQGIKSVPGYWDNEMKWNKGNFNPQDLILEYVMKS